MLSLGDNMIELKQLSDNSVDSVITDPPYGLKFMGKRWDYDVPAMSFWQEVLRVLKPGAHVLSFGGTRTYHRMVVAIEDAGFEIRDQVQWLYGSGFPKSLDVSKAIDKQAGAECEVIGTSLQWQGWGTALKPANEPIVLARKPLEKGLTVAENVLKWGCGAINVDGSRIEPIGMDPRIGKNISYGLVTDPTKFSQIKDMKICGSIEGRWPANIILDEAAAEWLDEQSGLLKSGGGVKTPKSSGRVGPSGWIETRNEGPACVMSSGGASRFFYVAKASKRERGIDNNHPTVKPIKLMEYLIKLITPPNGTVLDPFMGSGSTGVACKNLSFQFIGMELIKEYFEIAEKRMAVDLCS